jgi:uncharacterized protein (TIGR02217 family)
MAFLEQRLDTRIERGAVGGPTNRGRRKLYTSSGKLKQVFTWSAPVHEYDVSHGIRSAADIESLKAMWYVVNFTPYEGFRFRDWRDFQATTGNTTLTNISGSAWQLQRTYTFGGITFKRDIYKPNSDVAIFEAGGAPCTFTHSTETGIATVTSGTPATWTGTFDVPVTFKGDEFMETIEGASGNLSVQPAPILLEELMSL